MRIGIDARLGFGDSTGLGIHTRRLIGALARHDAGNEYVLYVDRTVDAPVLPPNFRVTLVPGRSRIAWTNLRLPGALRRDRIDLYHAVANFELPLAFAGLRVLTVHDLVPLHLPETVPWKHRLFFRLFTGPALRAADQVVAVSEHTRRDLISAFRLAPSAIEVVPNWVNETFRPPSRGADGDAPERAAARRGLRTPYFIFVGVREPKKNLDRLLDAFAQLVRARPGSCQLAIVGPSGWHTEALGERIHALGLDGHVRLTGRVAEADLVELMQDARALVFPSLTEGFGLPVLEAMACGTAVIASRAGALPEVGGDAAVYVDPLSTTDIAAALERLLGSPDLARELGARGVERATRWSEAAAAQRWVDLYLELFNRPS